MVTAAQLQIQTQTHPLQNSMIKSTKIEKKMKHRYFSTTNESSTSKKKTKNNMAPLYSEDVGTEGVTQSNGPILRGPESFNFKVQETDEELRRRLKRKARFGLVDEEDGCNITKGGDVDGLSSSLPLGALNYSSSTKVTKGKPLPPFAFKNKYIRKNDKTPIASTVSAAKEAPTPFQFKNKFVRKNNKTVMSSTGSSSSALPTKKARFVGTNQDLSKPYLRITTFLKPEQVRPLEVLVKSLAHIKTKYFQTEDFDYANEQLKSVRQDITVQRLRNKFVLDVYETHARILLEHGDLNEFNQCQTVIRYLTTAGHLGDVDMNTMAEDELGCNDGNNEEEDEQNFATAPAQSEEAADEFRAYGMLYALIQNSRYDLQQSLTHSGNYIQDGAAGGVGTEEGSKRGKGEANHTQNGRTSSSRHALLVVKAVIHNDYRAFFRLYESAPHMSAYLMDFLVKRMRESAYERIIASYRPTISVEHFREALYFQDLEETRCFLRKSGAIFVEEKGEPPFWVNCKQSKVVSRV